MKKRNVLITFVTIGLLCSCSRLPVQSTWSRPGADAAGRAAKRPIPLTNRDDKLRFSFGFANDEQNLYLCIKTNDQPTQMAMLQSGFFLGIDTTPKKNFPVSIAYPLHQKPQVRDEQRNDRQQPPSDQDKVLEQGRSSTGNIRPASRNDLRQIKERMLEQQDRMVLKGFRSRSDGTYPLNEGGISVNVDLDTSGVLVYAAIIPFRTFFRDHLVPADTAKTWSFSMILNGMEVPMGRGMRSGPRMGIGMGGPGMRIGGSIPLGGGGGPGRVVMPPKSEWNYLKLSFKPAK